MATSTTLPSNFLPTHFAKLDVEAAEARLRQWDPYDEHDLRGYWAARDALEAAQAELRAIQAPDLEDQEAVGVLEAHGLLQS